MTGSQRAALAALRTAHAETVERRDTGKSRADLVAFANELTAVVASFRQFAEALPAKPARGRSKP